MWEIFETSWPNTPITGIEEFRIRYIENIFSGIIEENFPNLGNDVAYVCTNTCIYDLYDLYLYPQEAPNIQD